MASSIVQSWWLKAKAEDCFFFFLGVELVICHSSLRPTAVSFVAEGLGGENKSTFRYKGTAC